MKLQKGKAIDIALLAGIAGLVLALVGLGLFHGDHAMALHSEHVPAPALNTDSQDATGMSYGGTHAANIAPPTAAHVKYFKSTMMEGETSPTPRKDSMGMDMVPVSEDKTAAETPK